MPAVSAGAVELPSRDAVVCDLLSNAIARFGVVRVKVLGGSMLPTIWPGDVLSIQKSDLMGLSPSDVIAFRRGSRLYAHRLLAAVSDGPVSYLATKGDALAEPDAPVRPLDVLGRVYRIDRGPFCLDPRLPATPVWRVALALVEAGRRIRRFAARVTRRRGATSEIPEEAG